MEDVLEGVRSVAVDGEIACADAHDLAAALDMTPQALGRLVNRAAELRFNRCQLGLFGYGSKPRGEHKIVMRAVRVPIEIEAEIRAVVSDGHISCADIWAIAERFRYPRLGLANIVEALDLKVTPCQLGCF